MVNFRSYTAICAVAHVQLVAGHTAYQEQQDKARCDARKQGASAEGEQDSKRRRAASSAAAGSAVGSSNEEEMEDQEDTAAAIGTAVEVQAELAKDGRPALQKAALAQAMGKDVADLQSSCKKVPKQPRG